MDGHVKNRISIKLDLSILFYISYALILISNIFVKIRYINAYLSYFKFAGIICCVLYILMKFYNNYKKIKLKNLIITILIVLFGILHYIKTGYFLILEFVILAIGAMNFDSKKLIKNVFFISLFMVISIVILYFLGYAVDISFTRLNGEIRYSFGFFHPNTLSYFLFIMLCELIYFSKNKIVQFLFLLLTAFITYKYTLSRTVLLFLIITLVYLIFDKQIIKLLKKKKIVDLIILVFPILFVVSFCVTLAYSANNDLIFSLDKLLSRRIMLQSYYYNKYGYTLLGQSVNYEFTLDNAYIKFLIDYGLITMLLYFSIYVTIIKRAFKKGDSYIIWIFLIIANYLLIENMILVAELNPFLILLFCNLKNTNQLEGEKNE